MDSRSIGLTVAIAGLLIVVAGALIYAGLLGWFGRLPGDIRIEGRSFRLYFPVVSMLLVSVVLTLVLALFRRM